MLGLILHNARRVAWLEEELGGGVVRSMSYSADESQNLKDMGRALWWSVHWATARRRPRKLKHRALKSCN